jgi:hypothetical protein
MKPSEAKRLLVELHDFRNTALYRHFISHFQTLYDVSVEQILEERLKGPETLYTREGWIGEARVVKLQITWFDELQQALEQLVREQED